MVELKKLPFYPYPNDGPTRFGFLFGDLISLGVVIMIAYAVMQNL